MTWKEGDLTIMQRADKLIDELYKENDHLKEDKQFLHDRCETLEQLVKDYRELAGRMETHSVDWSGKRTWLAKRATELIGEQENTL